MEFRFSAGSVDGSPQPADRARAARLRLLVVSTNKQAHAAIQSILPAAAWNISAVAHALDAAALLPSDDFAVVLCDWDGVAGGWTQMLNRPGRSGCAPRVIVFSHAADDVLWAEVLNLGGYDLLLFPFEREELTRIVRVAGENWQREARVCHAASRKPPGQVRIAAAGAANLNNV